MLRSSCTSHAKLARPSQDSLWFVTPETEVRDSGVRIWCKASVPSSCTGPSNVSGEVPWQVSHTLIGSRVSQTSHDSPGPRGVGHSVSGTEEKFCSYSMILFQYQHAHLERDRVLNLTGSQIHITSITSRWQGRPFRFGHSAKPDESGPIGSTFILVKGSLDLPEPSKVS